jgi:hypothetical protein
MSQTTRAKWALPLAAFFLMTTTAFAGVTVSSPAPGATSGSPVHFVASASSGHPITSMRIYVDNVSAFVTSSGSLNTSVPMSNGTHNVVVQAWDSAGAIYKTPETITVSGSTAPPPPTPAPVPGSAVVKASIQKMTGWSSCTTCAGAGGAGPSATFGFQQFVASPSLSGGAMKFSIGGKTPFSNALWWKQLGGDNSKTHFVYDLDFYLTTPQVAQALEFDVNNSNNIFQFIFGTECSIGRHEWDVWDTAGAKWIHTGAACPLPAAFKWHHLTWEFYRDSTTAHFVSVTMDGVKHYINRSFNVHRVPWNEINVAFQMDGNLHQQAYSTWLDNVTLRYW